jgi:hypothetical protein
MSQAEFDTLLADLDIKLSTKAKRLPKVPYGN